MLTPSAVREGANVSKEFCYFYCLPHDLLNAVISNTCVGKGVNLADLEPSIYHCSLSPWIAQELFVGQVHITHYNAGLLKVTRLSCQPAHLSLWMIKDRHRRKGTDHPSKRSPITFISKAAMLHWGGLICFSTWPLHTPNNLRPSKCLVYLNYPQSKASFIILQ